MNDYEQEQREREAFRAGANGGYYTNSGRTNSERERIYRAEQNGRNSAEYFGTVGSAISQSVPYLQIFLHYISKYSVFLILGFLIVYYPAGLFMKMPGFWKSDFGLFCKVYGIVLAVGLVPGYFILCLFHYLRAYVQVGKRKRIRYWRLWLALLHAFVTLIPIALIFYYWSNDRKDNFWVLAFLAISIIVAGVKCLSEMLNDGYAPRMVEWAFLKGEKHALKRFSNVKPSILPAKYRVILFCVAYFFLLHLTIPFLCGILGTLLHSNHLLDQGLILLFCYTLASLTSFWLITPFTNYLYNYDYRRDLSSAAVKKTILITVPVALVLKVLVLFLTFDAGVISKLISFGLPLVSCGLGVVLMDKFRKNDSVNS